MKAQSGWFYALKGEESLRQELRPAGWIGERRLPLSTALKSGFQIKSRRQESTEAVVCFHGKAVRLQPRIRHSGQWPVRIWAEILFLSKAKRLKFRSQRHLLVAHKLPPAVALNEPARKFNGP
ncbi:hypothetical protein ACDY96_25160 [Rhizobium mongolense]|uniref:hypothetical protein n=1 Tax=Rhizobium mongolense TaxID=57676 RepID=UPI0035560F98